MTSTHYIKHLVINSKDRISGDESQFIVNIPTISGLNAVELLQAYLPNTIYNITASNNTILWNNGAPNTSTLTPGAYDINTIIAEIISQTGWTTVTASYSTFRLTFTNAVAFSLTGGTALDILGFNPQAIALSHVGNYAIRLDIPKTYIIKIDQLHSGNIYTTNNNHSGNFVIISKVNSGMIDYYSKNTDFNICNAYQGQNITQLNVSIYENGTLLDLNGSDWSFILRLCY